ncbi:hypothetical protein JCGZ_04132 [Jatropha curcas]|uniref:Uncharacterized protein n=1 Tax=Jatropha curcas TaxID=180498 RepID=A0A067JCX7_JATCU|nr:hypothetical protein JCGZ_04132 [Jatropha curcas]
MGLSCQWTRGIRQGCYWTWVYSDGALQASRNVTLGIDLAKSTVPPSVDASLNMVKDGSHSRVLRCVDKLKDPDLPDPLVIVGFSSILQAHFISIGGVGADYVASNSSFSDDNEE